MGTQPCTVQPSFLIFVAAGATVYAANKMRTAAAVVRREGKHLNAQPSQIALAWLLRKSPVMLPIPGTSKVKHLDENTAAALIQLDDATTQELERLGKVRS
jgi:pyridoxine 4-dehydrogenase